MGAVGALEAVKALGAAGHTSTSSQTVAGQTAEMVVAAKSKGEVNTTAGESEAVFSVSVPARSDGGASIHYWDLIRGVYERKNPSKLAELESMMSKFAGREVELYALICEKYGETPARLSSVPVRNTKDQASAENEDDAVRLGAAAAAALLQASLQASSACADGEVAKKLAPAATTRSQQAPAKRKDKWDDFEIIDEVASEVSQSLDGDRTEEEPGA